MTNLGNTNELCGEPVDLSTVDFHVFRCEIYGQYINIKKSNQPALYPVSLAEVIVNAEPTSKCNSAVYAFLLMLLFRYSDSVSSTS